MFIELLEPMNILMKPSFPTEQRTMTFSREAGASFAMSCTAAGFEPPTYK